MVAADIVLIVIVAVLVADILRLQARTIREQRKTIDTLWRAAARERAAAEILRSELDHLSMSAQLVALWRARGVNVS